MPDALTLVLFVAGFFALIKGADLLVEGSSKLAKKMGVSAFVIGITVVAFGTSVPELVVNVIASLHGNTGIVLGNILGSNIANIFLVLGVSAVLVPIVVKRSMMRKELPLSLLAIVVVAVLANDTLIAGQLGPSVLGLDDGVVLVSFFAMFVYYIYSITRKGPVKKEVVEMEKEAEGGLTGVSRLRLFVLISLGLAGVLLGGKWINDGAVSIATELGVSQTLIGLTVIALGTSIPELATSIMAVYRKASEIAVGNIIGSNIFNIFWILGIGAVIAPIPFSAANNFEVGTVIFATVLMFVFMMYVGKKYEMERWQGIVFLALYAAFTILTVLRG